jgi:23S rRNA-intervening sequence protein
MNYFDHEKLDVYQAAIDLVILINTIVENLPRGRAYLADQLQRAGASVPPAVPANLINHVILALKALSFVNFFGIVCEFSSIALFAPCKMQRNSPDKTPPI